MARQRSGGRGGSSEPGFLGRIISQIRRRAREGLRPGRGPQCWSWMFRWEWLDDEGNRVASGTHAVVIPSGTNRQMAQGRARAQVQRLHAAYLAQLAGRYPGGRLHVTRIGAPVQVSGPC